MLGEDAGEGLFAGPHPNPAYRDTTAEGSVFIAGERIDQYKGVRIRAKMMDGKCYQVSELIKLSKSSSTYGCSGCGTATILICEIR